MRFEEQTKFQKELSTIRAKYDKLHSSLLEDYRRQRLELDEREFSKEQQLEDKAFCGRQQLLSELNRVKSREEEIQVTSTMERERDTNRKRYQFYHGECIDAQRWMGVRK